MEKWKVLEREYLYQTPFGNLRKDKCQVKADYIIDAYHVNEFSDWVNAVVITKQSEMVFVKQYRHGAGDVFYEIPAGAPEKGETYAEAIKREVLEETGYASETEPIRLGEFFVNPATQNNKVITFLIPNAMKVSEQNLDEGEVIEVSKTPFRKVETMVKTEQLRQLFSVTAYHLAKNYFMGEGEGL